MREDGRAARHRAETTTATIEDTARRIVEKIRREG